MVGIQKFALRPYGLHMSFSSSVERETVFSSDDRLHSICALLRGTWEIITSSDETKRPRPKEWWHIYIAAYLEDCMRSKMRSRGDVGPRDVAA